MSRLSQLVLLALDMFYHKLIFPFPLMAVPIFMVSFSPMLRFLKIFKVICALKPKAGGNKTIVKQEREISEADWIPVDDFLEHGSGKFFL